MSVCVVRRHFGSRRGFFWATYCLGMESSLSALYAWGAARALLWCTDLGEVPPGAKQRHPGIIVFDSGAFVRGAEHWSVYMQDVLQAVYENTGQRCIVVARGGASFNHRDVSRTYQHVFQCIKERCDAPLFMVWVSFGNDLYPPRADMRKYEAGVLAAVSSLLTLAFAYCPRHCFLYGASSEVWQYAKHFDSAECREYDRLVGVVCGHFLACRSLYPGLDARTGAELLHGVELADRIGHFSAGSIGMLRHFYTELVQWGMMWGMSRSRL